MLAGVGWNIHYGLISINMSSNDTKDGKTISPVTVILGGRLKVVQARAVVL